MRLLRTNYRSFWWDLQALGCRRLNDRYGTLIRLLLGRHAVGRVLVPDDRFLEVLDGVAILGRALRRLEALRLGHRQALVERRKRGNKREADRDPPHAVDLARVPSLHRGLVAQEHNHHHERADKRAPALEREDVGEHRAPPAHARALRGDRCRHRVVAADADAKHDAPYGQP